MRSTFATLLLGIAGAQEPAPSPTPAPAVDPAVARAGETLLRAHAERSRTVKVLVADYQQTRTTRLAREPLQSRGTFLFVRDPACIVFRATAPRVSVVRLRASLYEVFRPEQKRLERFRLDGPELAQGLFAAVGGDAELLLREFAVQACGSDPAAADRTLLVLTPRRDAVRERLRDLRLSLATKGGDLAAVAYVDPAGDLVEIALRNVRVDPDAPPSCEFDLPEGTTVVEHTPPKRSQ
jgi:hypothetical protein